MVSNIFYFHPYLGKWSNLTNIFEMGWNHQLENNGVDGVGVQQNAGAFEVMTQSALKELAQKSRECFWQMRCAWEIMQFLGCLEGISVAKLETWKFLFLKLSLSFTLFLCWFGKTLPETNSNWSHWKLMNWKRICIRSGFLFWIGFRPILRGCLTVSFREGKSKKASCFLFCVPTNFSSSTRIGHPCFREL